MSCRIVVTRRAGRRAIATIHVSAALIVAACQSGGGIHGPPRLEPRRQDILLSSEIATYPSANVYEVLRAARPLWMWNQGKPLSVSVDDAPPASIDLLRSIVATNVKEIRFLRAFSEARVRPTILPNGSAEFRDLIVVVTYRR